MRIAWFTHRYHPCIGGAETFGRAMIRRLVESGHSLDVLTSDAQDLWYFNDPGRRRLDAPSREVIDGANVQRFPVRHIPLQRYVGRLLSYVPHWPTRCRFASYMPILPDLDDFEGEYDAVFAVGFPFTVFAYAAWRIARASNAPLILTPFLHLATPGDKVQRQYTRSHQIRLLRESETVVVVTELEARAVEGWGIARDRILKLNMGVEHDAVTGGGGERFRTKFGIPQGRPLVGHLATLDPNKGTNDLVLALDQLNASRPADDPIHLALCGVSSPHFEAFAATLPSTTKRWLHRTGPLSVSEKADFFDAIDTFAMPSRTDSFGIVFLEAWANGKPVVAADAGGVSEVVAHNQTGLLVPFGAIERIALAIEWLIQHPESAARLGAAGQAQVSNGHTWDDCFALLDARLQALTSTRRHHPPHNHQQMPAWRHWAQGMTNAKQAIALAGSGSKRRD